MTSTPLRIYTAGVAVLCGGLIAYSIDRQHAADAWQAEAAGWQRAAAHTVSQNRHAAKRMNALARRYNHLVVATRHSQRALLAAGSSAAVPTTIYRTSVATAAPAASSAPIASAAPPPSTHTS